MQDLNNCYTDKNQESSRPKRRLKLTPQTGQRKPPSLFQSKFFLPQNQSRPFSKLKRHKPVAAATVYLKHKDVIAKLAKTSIFCSSKKVELKKTAETKVKVREEPYFPPKLIIPAVVSAPHEIIKSNLSTEEDIHNQSARLRNTSFQL